jgi:osmotically-inducible protein OsmY
MNLRYMIAALAFAATTTACSNTADGVKKDANNAADKTANAANATGNAMGGAMQTGEVKTALLADTRIDASDINVDTDETAKTVTLKGTVKADAQKTIAAEIATTKAAGYKIVNELTIKP